jgi:hypothetical protein
MRTSPAIANTTNEPQLGRKTIAREACDFSLDGTSSGVLNEILRSTDMFIYRRSAVPVLVALTLLLAAAAWGERPTAPAANCGAPTGVEVPLRNPSDTGKRAGFLLIQHV